MFLSNLTIQVNVPSPLNYWGRSWWSTIRKLHQAVMKNLLQLYLPHGRMPCFFLLEKQLSFLSLLLFRIKPIPFLQASISDILSESDDESNHTSSSSSTSDASTTDDEAQRAPPPHAPTSSTTPANNSTAKPTVNASAPIPAHKLLFRAHTCFSRLCSWQFKIRVNLPPLWTFLPH